MDHGERTTQPQRRQAGREERQRISEVMAAIAGGDRAAVFTLVEEFEGPLRAAARRAAGRLNVRLGREEERELAIEVALALVDVAGAWRPDGGALPWVWAERRVVTAVARWVGQHGQPLDHDPPAPEVGGAPDDDDADLREVLARAADPRLRLFGVLAGQLGWEKAEVWLEVEMQRAAGDPAPNETVARMTGRSSDAVRQLVCRSRRRARVLVAEDPALSALAGCALVG